jgi:hypothetical protein
MKTLVIAFALIFVCWFASAQDNIVFKDGTEVKAKVQEITTTEVVYKRHDNLEGPVYRVERGKVFIIQFENGTTEVVSPLNLNQVPGTSYNGRRQLVGSAYRSPGLAWLFSFIVPGGGQYYNRQYGKGAAMSALWLGGIITAATSTGHYRNDSGGSVCYTDYNGNYICNNDRYYRRVDTQRTIGMVTLYGSWIWSMIDAPIIAARTNRRNAKGLTSLLDFNVGDKAQLRLHPFRSQGLGGSLSVSF